MVFTRPLISKSSSPCTNSLFTMPSAPVTIGITLTFMFHVFFRSLARSRYFSLFLQFYPMFSRNGKSLFGKFSLFVFIGNPFEMRLLNLRINFLLLRTFCPHLGSFFCCCCIFSLRFGQISTVAFFSLFIDYHLIWSSG